MRKILVMGLPGAGKTTLATTLAPFLSAITFNADAVRANLSRDLGFSHEDRIEHARRMGWMCDRVVEAGGTSIADFICPTEETRAAFGEAFTIWVDRIRAGRFEDTNQLFTAPARFDFRVSAEGTPQYWAEQVLARLRPAFSQRKPAALFDMAPATPGPAPIDRRTASPGALPALSYLVCTEPRSGSTLLCDALASTGIAGRPDEYFVPGSSDAESYWMRRLRIIDEADYVDAVIREATTPNRVFGVKVHWAQAEVFRSRLVASLAHVRPDLRNAPFDRLLREKLGATRYVWLRRRNKVAQGISYYRALETAVWRSAKGRGDQESALARTLDFDFAKIDRAIALVHDWDWGWDDYFHRHRVAPLMLVYEDMVANFELTVRGVLKFLGLPYEDAVIAAPDLERQADDRSRDWEQRYREAKARQVARPAARPALSAGPLPAFGRTADPAPRREASIKELSDDAAANAKLAAGLRDAGRYAQAVAHYERAIVLAPDFAAAHAGLGTAHLEAGRIDEARQCYERAARLEPWRPTHFLDLSRSMRFTLEHPCLEPLLDLARDIDAMSEGDKIDLHFALAKALADLGDQHASFAHQLAGNALKRRSISYDETEALGHLQRIQRVFTAKLIEERQNHGIASPDPIFIVGMPRSGSTLVEQILASHPQVFGAGEVEAFSLALRMAGLLTPERPFPESVSEWTADDLARAADQYLRLLRRDLPLSENRIHVTRLTDKLLANFQYAGLIHLMLPRARIIHTRRDPIDTCLSCFSIQFATLRYTCDLGELGRYYAAYARLMDHWRAVLPAGRILEVQYEQVVEDVETMARRIIAHCGLEWDDACLRFYETQRPVRTSSVTQVRGPIYRNSIGRWRPDAEVLHPLLEALGKDINATPFIAATSGHPTEQTVSR
jgi:LPS sulfotransferase NodH